MIARIIKKASQDFVGSIGKIGIGFIVLNLLYFEKYSNILSYDWCWSHIKFIYIDSSHIYKKSLVLRLDVDSN